jgi:hypothetical protein
LRGRGLERRGDAELRDLGTHHGAPLVTLALTRRVWFAVSGAGSAQ